MTTARFAWTPEFVASRNVPATLHRTLLEYRDLGAILEPLELDTIAEIGCGFGRLFGELTKHPQAVTAFEREPELVKWARRLYPSVAVVEVPALTELPVEDDAFDLVLTFTVLQHMTNADAAAVLSEAKRVSRRFVLVVEDTDPRHVYKDRKRPGHFTIGRSVRNYRRLLEPFELVRVARREVEPGYSSQGKPRPYVGHYMLYERRAA